METPQGKNEQPVEFQQIEGGEISVEEKYPTYRATEQRPTGWFETGQDADIMLSGIDFDNTGGSLLFNHPGGIASDGEHLLLADRNNNRVLIWNTLPTENTPPDLVLGQTNFISNATGTGLDGMNWPVAVAADGSHVIVADTYNDRILIWNTFPKASGQPADLELRRDKNERGPIAWPWAVWSNGEKLMIASTGGSQVLIWSTFPDDSEDEPDVVLHLDAFGTPRSIGSDGERLVIGDHNAFKESQGNFFWKEFPTADDAPYDFFMRDVILSPQSMQGTNIAQGTVFWGNIFTEDGTFLNITSTLNIWNAFPEDENDLPDLQVGTSGGPRQEGREKSYAFFAGDGSGTALAGEMLYISLGNGNKIVGYSSLPTEANQKPDIVIGAPDIETNTLDTYNIMSNPVPATDGTSLFVSSDFDKKLYVWKHLPDESGALPDYIYNVGGWDNEYHNGIFAQVNRSDVYIWTQSPATGALPDIAFHERIGDVTLNSLAGVAIDDTYFYLADTGTNAIYVWEGLPSDETAPVYTLTADQPYRLSSDGKYLVVTATLSNETGHLKIFPVDQLSDSAEPIVLQFQNLRTNLPQSAVASHGSLFVGDTGFNRVLIWKDIEDAIASKAPDTILGEDNLDDIQPEIGKNKVFWPGGIAFDGSYLWVGEFKFSERLLRFSVR